MIYQPFIIYSLLFDLFFIKKLVDIFLFAHTLDYTIILLQKHHFTLNGRPRNVPIEKSRQKYNKTAYYNVFNPPKARYKEL